MNPTARTSIFVAAAAVLLVITAVAVPQRQQHDQFREEGERLFPPFAPLDVISMEVTEYDEERGVVKPFKVAFQGGEWVIPSHENYPADAKDQLADTAALLVGLVKGDFRSDREADYKTFGVIDPRDVTSAGFTGRGKRITLNDKTGRTVADLIIGREVGGDSRYGYYYVRKPDSKRVYTCKVDAGGISTRFADWVETDLLQLASDDIVQVELDRHKVDEVSGRVIPGELATLRLKDEEWELVGGVPKGNKNANELDTDKLNTLKDSISALTLVGVRRKPPGILDIVRRAEDGYRLTRQEHRALQFTLQPHGYFIGQNPSTGEVLVVSNEGEIRVKSKDGVVYKLRFGEVVYGEPDEISAAQKKKQEKAAEAAEAAEAVKAKREAGFLISGLDAEKTKEDEKDDDSGREHRYLWVVMAFDESLLGPKPQPPVKTDKPQEEQEKKEDSKDGKDEDEDEEKDKDDYDQRQEEYEEKLQEYEKKLEDGKKRAEQLKQRFAEWYYVISADAYKKVNLSHENIFKKKEVEAEEDESTTDDKE